MLYRGIEVTYEAIRRWNNKFAQTFANEIRRRRPQTSGQWHLDEMEIKIDGEKHILWRAVDEHGQILDILVQKRRNTQAAKRFLKKIIKKERCTPKVVVTDKLKSYRAAMRELELEAEHREHKGLNNRTELSHQWTRVREKKMRRFKSAGQAQKFLSAFELIYQQTQPKRHKLKAEVTRIIMKKKIETWKEITGFIVSI